MKKSIQMLIESIKGLKDYVNYLIKIYVKRDGDKFISHLGYAKYLLDAISLLKETPESFFAKVDTLNKTTLYYAVLKAANEKYPLDKRDDLMVVVRNYINFKLYTAGGYDMYGNRLELRKAA